MKPILTKFASVLALAFFTAGAQAAGPESLLAPKRSRPKRTRQQARIPLTTQTHWAPNGLLQRALAGRELLQSAFKRRESTSHVRLGDALIQEGLITVAQRDAALATQSLQLDYMLGEILVEGSVVTAEVIRRVLVEQLGVPSVDLAQTESDPDALKAISGALARKYSVVPLYLDMDRIAVAMENPMWWEALKELESATGLRVDPAVAPRADINRALERHYPVTLVCGETVRSLPTTLRDVPAAIVIGPMDECVRALSRAR